MKFLKEEEEKPSGWFAADYDIIVQPTEATPEETIKAFEDKDNYGIYTANMRSKKITQADIDAHFGPTHRATKMKLEKERGEPFPLRTKQAMDDFIKSKIEKPNLVKYRIEGDLIVFPKERNPSKDATMKIIKTVLDSAGIKYKIKEKESFTESQLRAMIKEQIIKQLKK